MTKEFSSPKWFKDLLEFPKWLSSGCLHTVDEVDQMCGGHEEESWENIMHLELSWLQSQKLITRLVSKDANMH